MCSMICLIRPSPTSAVFNAAHNFALLKLSLEDQLAQYNKALVKAKVGNVA